MFSLVAECVLFVYDTCKVYLSSLCKIGADPTSKPQYISLFNVFSLKSPLNFSVE